MKKSIIVAILLLVLFLSACSEKTAEVSNTAECETTQEVSESSFSEEITEEETTEETSPIPTVANDIDYYEMFYEDINSEEAAEVSDSRYMHRGAQYAKEWVSTDGKISFILDAVYGPFGTVGDIDAKYTANGVEYDTKVMFEPNKFKMYIGEFGRSDYTTLLIGAYEYNHEEQSFTVTAATKNLTVYLDESTWITADEYYEKFGDSAAPVYNAEEKVTFKMVR